MLPPKIYFLDRTLGIERNTSLDSIDLHYECGMGSPDFEVLANALTVNKTLKEVTLQPEGTEWTYWVFVKWCMDSSIGEV